MSARKSLSFPFKKSNMHFPHLKTENESSAMEVALLKGTILVRVKQSKFA